MVENKDRIKLIVAIVLLVVAAVVFAVQYWPSSGGGSTQAATTTPLEEVSTDQTGAKVIRQGSHAQRQTPPGK